MNIEQLYLFCKNFSNAKEIFPFDKEMLVFKVFDKMFALLDMKRGDRVNLKCDPLKAEDLNEKYSSILLGYHMNKKHWKTVMLSKELKDDFMLSLVLDLYHLVIPSYLKKSKYYAEKVNGLFFTGSFLYSSNRGYGFYYL